MRAVKKSKRKRVTHYLLTELLAGYRPEANEVILPVEVLPKKISKQEFERLVIEAVISIGNRRFTEEDIQRIVIRKIQEEANR